MKNSSNKYIYSIIALFICVLILAPSTVVYANELVNKPVFSIIQPITGVALPIENLHDSLTERLNYYLVDSYTNGIIDEQKYNEIVSSGMISETAFFENSVFVGDSLTVGFSDYCRTHDSIASESTYFLARVSCSAKATVSKNALTKYANIMPKYNGRVQYIEDSVSQLPNVKKLFICYGMNDLTSSTPEQFLEDMQTLIARITEKTPGLQVYVISIPCVVANVNNGYLNNKNIQTANILLQNACVNNGWGFINIAEYLMGADNALRPEYSSDNYVHENTKAYHIWNKVLKEYAYLEITK